MKKFEVVPGSLLATGSKRDGGELVSVTERRFKIRNNESLKLLPEIYNSKDEAQAKCDELESN
jgi:hypothetical protein